MGSVIAVVVPVFRQAQFMRDAIRSVERQDIVGDVRLVIVNDGCPDSGTKEYGEAAVGSTAVASTYVEQPHRGLGIVASPHMAQASRMGDQGSGPALRGSVLSRA